MVTIFMKKIFQRLYHLLPFKREVFIVLKTIWQPKESIYRHLHFIGVFKVKIDKKRYFKIKHYGFQLENEMFWKGLNDGWEKESTKLWLKLCEHSEIIFDVGANTGLYALLAKGANPTSKVYAFEPVTRVYDRLKENIALNNFDITPISKALSNFDGTAIIYDTTETHIYSVTVNRNLNDPKVPVLEKIIETITLNTFIAQNGIKKIDLMKLDVETHEPEVLEGFSDYLFSFKPTLLIEILSNEVGEKVQTLVKDAGYLYFNINERGGIRQVQKIGKSDFYNYLFCTMEIAKKIGLSS